MTKVHSIRPILKTFLIGLLPLLFVFNSCTQQMHVGKTRITFATFDDGNRAYWEEVIYQYNQNQSDIEVVFVPVDFSQQLTSEVIGTLGDVIYLGDYLQVYSDQFLPLDALINASATYDPDDYWPNIEQACTDKIGNYIGVPFSVNLIGLYYKPEHFQKANIPIPDVGWTLEEFQDTLHSLSEVYEGVLFVDNPFFSFLDGYISTAIDPRIGEFDLQYINELAIWYFSLVDNGTIFPYFSSHNGLYSEEQDQILKNQLAKAAYWVGPLNPLNPGYEEFESFQYIPFPTSEGGTNPVLVNCAGISTGSQYKKEAWDFLNYLSTISPSISPNAFSDIATRRSVFHSLDYQGQPDELIEKIEYALENNTLIAVKQPYIQNIKKVIAEYPLNEGGVEHKLEATLESSKYEGSVLSTQTVIPVVNTPAVQENINQVVINYLDYQIGFNEREELVTLAKEFSKQNPHILINFLTNYEAGTYQSFSNNLKKMDCSNYRPSLAVTINSDEVIDLTPFIVTDPNLRDDFPEKILELFKHDGKLLALPSSISPLRYLVVNRELFENSKIPIPLETWDIEGLLNKSNLIAQSNEQVFGSKLGYDLLLEAWDIQTIDTSGEIPKANFLSLKLINAVKRFQDLYGSHIFLPAYGELAPKKPDNYEPYINAVRSGLVGIWEEVGLGEEYDFPVEYVRIPRSINGTRLGEFYQSSVKGFFISANSQHPNECWEWIRYLSDHPLESTNAISPRLSSVDLYEGSARIDQHLKTLLKDILETGTIIQTPLTDIRVYAYIDWQYDAFLKVINGEKAEIALAEAQQKADTYYECLLQSEYIFSKSDEYREKVINPCFEKASQ